jgi:uncharacterized RDD family membrane protein YckC
MSSDSDSPKKGPPPPDLKTAPPPPDLKTAPSPPTPSITKPAAAPPIKVGVRPDTDDDEESSSHDSSDAVPFNTRFLAMVIDLAIGLGLYLSVIIFANMTLDFFKIFASPLFIAFILTRDGLPFLGGQSPGKTAMKIKAVTIGGESLAGNWQPALIRNAVLLIPLFGFVELIVLLNREEKKDQGIRLGDELAKTRVVKADTSEED